MVTSTDTCLKFFSIEIPCNSYICEGFECFTRSRYPGIVRVRDRFNLNLTKGKRIEYLVQIASIIRIGDKISSFDEKRICGQSE